MGLNCMAARLRLEGSEVKFRNSKKRAEKKVHFLCPLGLLLDANHL
jgi:hypothetical protein